MARSRGSPGRSAPVRRASTVAAPQPVARPPPSAAPAPVQHTPQQHTAAQPPPVAAAQPKQPGLFAQMAATAGGVAIGSAIGNTISHAMFGGRSSDAPQQAPAEPVAQQAAQPVGTSYFDQTSSNQFQQNQQRSCDSDAKAFTTCMESTNNDFSSCSYYLDMLKQCQAFAKNQTL
ncbi:hypothetical protein BB559_007508 [Furculomyces boomerangus]|uniref:CHCH domain-containing protein n=2 Tax=Harpellales TaxID=61421 RepID=A0A2T9XX36_9FUNG|nr:hypothetical protein BB559_007508 [Furculomyces boomerangus]PWA00810.1 hypothetical protein BB558_003116 [Smittium angustum]